MKTVLFVFILLITGISARSNLLKLNETALPVPVKVRSVQEDSLQALQDLYRGTTWINKFRRFRGDPFYLDTRFIPATVSANGHVYKKLRIRYDIYSDEILIPLNMDEIIILNKEMVDSFTLYHNNKTCRFINTDNDSAGGPGGYCELIYRGNHHLYVKHTKIINTSVSDESDGEFNQKSRIYVRSAGRCFQVRNKKDLLKNLEDRAGEIRNYLREKKIRLSKNDPESFAGLIKYLDSIR